LTASFDGTLHVTSLCTDFDSWKIEPKELEVTCFTLRSPTFNPSHVEFFIGTTQGKFFYYYSAFLSSQKEVIHDDKNEGIITNCICYNDLVVWSTATKIRLIHYSKRQKICLIE
jgi:hypothetical protein